MKKILALIGRLCYMFQRLTRYMIKNYEKTLFKKLGKNVYIGNETIFSFSTIEIGDDVYIGPKCVFQSVHGSIKIGSGVMFGAGVHIHGGDHTFNRPCQFMKKINDKKLGDDSTITIGSDVWIGSNAIILKGVTIGDGCVVGAGSVVTKDLPPCSIAVGNPARVIKLRFDEETIAKHLEFICQENQKMTKYREKRFDEDNASVKKKIMIAFIEGGDCGGPYVSHRRIVESSLKEKYDFVPLISHVRYRGLRRLPLMIWDLCRQIKAANPDAVQVCGLQSEGWYMLIAAKLMRKPVILVVHGSVTEAASEVSRFRLKEVGALERYALRHADITYCVSDYLTNLPWLKHSVKNLYGRIYNLPHFEYSSNRDPMRQKLGISSDKIVVVSTGRITAAKGFDVLTSVMQEVAKRGINSIEYLIAGDGDYLPEMKRRAQESELNKIVHFLGKRNDVPDVLAASDIFVLCTNHETLGNSILEAGAQGLPLVATNVGGIPEIIDDGECGYLVEKGDVSGFADKIIELAGVAQLRRQMGETAQKKISQKFSATSILAQLDEIYEKYAK